MVMVKLLCAQIAANLSGKRIRHTVKSTHRLKEKYSIISKQLTAQMSHSKTSAAWYYNVRASTITSGPLLQREGHYYNVRASTTT